MGLGGSGYLILRDQGDAGPRREAGELPWSPDHCGVLGSCSLLALHLHTCRGWVGTEVCLRGFLSFIEHHCPVPVSLSLEGSRACLLLGSLPAWTLVPCLLGWPGWGLGDGGLWAGQAGPISHSSGLALRGRCLFYWTWNPLSWGHPRSWGGLSSGTSKPSALSLGAGRLAGERPK